MAIRVNFNWKLAVFVVLFLPILLSLGSWQLKRAEEKRAMLEAQDRLVQLQAEPMASLTPEKIENYRNVHLRGEYLNKIWLVDNQIYEGKFGYEVVQVFKQENGQHILISRGWKEGSVYREQLPQIEFPQGIVTAQGYLYQPSTAYKLEEEVEKTAWPRVIQSIDVQNMYKVLAENDRISTPFLVRLSEEDANLLTQHWQIINVQPEKHTGYAIQWFGMAILLVVLFAWASLKKSSV